MIGAVPSIDLFSGKAARLRQGRRGTEEYFGDPLGLAEKYENAGFMMLHIVDLDAAFGRGSQLAILKKIAAACPSLMIQWAGGIRSLDSAEMALSSGASRIVFGTAVASSPELVRECSDRFGSMRVWASLDFGGAPPCLMVKGWEESARIGLDKVIENAEKCKVGGMVISSVDADGMETGPNLSLLAGAKKLTDSPLWLAGGVRNPKDAKAALLTGAEGVIIGRALYDSKIGVEGWTCLGKI